jgi:hypothetical protein
MQQVELEATVRQYLKAFDDHDLPRCLEFFAEDARIDFAMGVYQGSKAIEDWHAKRFAADLKVLRVERIQSNGDTVTVDAIATSSVARAWKFPSIAGAVTFVFDQGRIKEGRFRLRTPIPLENWL